jgi:hypothetical protein
MLDENITIVLLSTTFIGGQAALIGYVVYKNAFLNNIALNNAVDEMDDEEQEEEEEHGEELQPEEYEDANEEDEHDEDKEDSGADADNEEGRLNSGNPPVTNDTPATPAPVVDAKCVGCDNDCTKCMPGLTVLGDLPDSVVCEGGVCRLANGVTTSQMWKDMLAEEGVKID